MTQHSTYNQLTPNGPRRGFTIVELLIVIIVIAILAALATIAYTSITRNASEASMKSDLETAASQVDLHQRSTGLLPATAADANGGKGFEVTSGNTLSYIQKPYGYCMTVTSTKSSEVYRFKSSTKQMDTGACETATVSTLAGNATASFVDNPTGSAARFRQPGGIAVDASGTVYVGDTYNNRIRKVTSTGATTTLAGSTAGLTEATGAAAQFNTPYGVALDPSGANVYVADWANSRIRKVTNPGGVVTTYAGTTSGLVEGAATTTARFSLPYDVAVATDGTVYVADTGNHRIRKITTGGVVSTLAGSTQGYTNANGTAAQFYSPMGVAVDAAGTVYVADSYNNRIRKILPNGDVSTLAGSTQGYADGIGAAAQFYRPSSLTVGSNGTIYVSDNSNNRIRQISSTGVVSTLAGSGTAGFLDGADVTARFYAPIGITIDSTGIIYVADNTNNRIRKITQ